MAGLTNHAIAKAPVGSTVRDNRVPGLHCRVFANRKSFYLHYRTKAGRQRKPKIGDLGIMSIDDARKIASDMLTEVAAGGDPIADRKKARGEMTMESLFETAWSTYWDTPRFRKSGHARDVRYKWANHLKPRFGRKRLSEVTRKDIRQLKRDMESTPTSFNRALEVLSRIYNFAEEEEIRDPGTNPCAGVKAYPEKKRSRYATADELRALGKIFARDAAAEPRPVAFLLVLLLSGARPRSIERATEDQLARMDVNGEPFGVLTFQGKTSAETGEDEQVVLPPLAMRALDQVPRDEGDHRLIGMNAPRKYWERVRKEAGCPDLWMRDLRRTFATVGLSGGKVSLAQVGELLNHRDEQTTKVYAKLVNEARVSAVTDIAGRVQELIEAA